MRPNEHTKSAFVTGGTGFLGSRVVRLLADAGWDVTMLARTPSKAPAVDGVRIVEGDLGSASRLTEVMPADVDAVFHIAANIDFSASAAAQWQDNVEGTEHVLEAALAHRAKRFVFTSTSAVWGIEHERFDETSERHGARANIAYVTSKIAAEERVQAAVERGLHAVILNPGHIVGRSTGAGWDQLFERLRAGRLAAVPPGIASWCDVDALAEAHLAAAERGQRGANYLIGGCDATYKEFAAAGAEKLGVRAPGTAPAILVRTAARWDGMVSKWKDRAPEIPFDLARIMCGRLLFSSDRAKRELGYAPVDLSRLVDRALPDAKTA